MDSQRKNQHKNESSSSSFLSKPTDESIWIDIQQKTFTNWVNEQLKPNGLYVQNLQQDFSNGLKLIALVECLQKRRLKKVQKPLNQHQSIENVQIALNAIASDCIRLVNIGSTDIVSGNLKLILGLLWQLITRYQLGKASTPPKKLMLSWLESAIPELKIKNFTKDWNNGIALAALLDFCQPGIFGDWRKLSPKNCLENCHKAMTIAKAEFNIPMIITAEDLSNPNLDEKSSLTYLSYFMKENGPGYNLVINWARQMLPNMDIKNLTTDWNSGILFCQLLSELGANGINLSKLNSDKKYWENNWSLAIDCCRQLASIEPPNQLKPKHFSDPNIEYISIMAYLTKLIHISRKQDLLRIIGVNLNNVFVQKEAIFNLELLSDNIELEYIRSEVHSSTNKLVTSEITVNKYGGNGKFVPVEPGLHELKIFYKDNLATKPLKIKVHPDLTNVIFSGIEPCSVGSLVEVVINSNGAGSSDVKVVAVSSTKRELNCELIEKDNSIIANFIPDEIGEWRIAITYSGEHINGSPFPCLVYDSNQVIINYHNNDNQQQQMAMMNENIFFTIDTRKAGWGKLDIKVVNSSIVNQQQQPISIEIDERGNGIYNVSFKPESAGKYFLHVTFNQQDVPNSPIEIDVKSSSMINDLNNRMKRATLDEISSINNNNNHNGNNKQQQQQQIDQKSIEVVENQEIFGTQVGKLAQLEINNLDEQTNMLSYFVKDPFQQELPALLKRISSPVGGGGSYKLEFKPLIVGSHTVFIDLDDQPIKGSPFIWNVYDCSQVKVFFPTNNTNNIMIGNDVHFEIDTSNAGLGNVEVLIDNGSIPCTLKPLSKTRYLGIFKRKSSTSNSIIDVRFNGESIPQSPFCLETILNGKHQHNNQNEDDVIDGIKSNGTFHIESLENFKVNQQTSFTISVKNMSITVEDLSVSILDMAISSVINYRIIEEPDNVYRCQFTASIVGTYQFKIFYKESMIHTFTAKAYDITKITVSDIPKKIILGQKCNIQVDASNAGEGQLEIAVNDGEVPNHVQVLGNGKCLISFKPEQLIEHVVDIKFNNENILGCPFRCQVDEFPDLKFDLSRIELVQVGYPVQFSIESSHLLEKNFSIIITSPSNKLLPVNLQQGNPMLLLCEFVPNEVGPYAINFEYCSKLVFNQPYLIKSFDPTKVIVSAPANGCVGKSIQFIVDAIYAGEGNLEISVVTNEKNVPTQVQPIGGAKFGVCFTPTQANDHIVSITFNNIAVNGNPFLVNVLPSTDKPIVTGSALYFSPVDQIARLTIHNVDSENDIIAKVQDGNNQVVSANIIKDLQNQCIHLEFLPKMPGEYKVQLKYKGEHIQGSPFMTKIYDIKKIKVKDIPNEICLGKMVTFLVEATNAGPGNLEVIVNNGKVPSTPKSLGPSLYAISFVPTDPEIHVIEIKFNGKNVENSPFRCKILDAEKVMFQPLEKVAVNKVAQITVDTNGGLLNENSIVILSPSHQNLKPILLGDHLNGYQIQFCPIEVGDHAIDIKIGGNSIPGCPFLVKVYDSKKVKVTDIKNGFVGKPIYFSINASPAGAGNLEIIVSSNGRNVPNYVQSEGNAKFRVNFKPTEATLHMISCKFNGEPVPGSPFTVQVFEETNPLGTLFSDSSIKNISLNKGVEFRIENPNNEMKQCQIIITTPSRKNINPTIEKLPNHFMIQFKPTEIGPHQMIISLDGLPVPGCPFTCNVYDVNKIKIGQLNKCIVRKPYTFQVDASQAGEGTLELVISTDNSSVRAEVLMKSRGLYDVTFLPQDCRPHYLNMTFNDEDVPGSPFNIDIIDSPVSPTTTTSSTLTTTGAPLVEDRRLLTGRTNQINVVNFRTQSSTSTVNNIRAIIVGPNKTKISGTLTKLDAENFKLEYLPKTIGKYKIEIFENDKHLWKEPIFIDIVDPNQIQVTMPANHCLQGKEYEFNVNTSKAGEGELLVKIISSGDNDDRKEIPFKMKNIESKLFRFSFIPETANNHHIEIYFNKYPANGSPFQINVQPHLESIIIYGDGLKTAHCNERAIFFIESEDLSANDFDIIVTDPNRSPLPVKCYQQKNGCLLVEWLPKKIGSHKIEVFHGDKSVKIVPIESSSFVINKKINLHLNRKNAGYAELDVTVTSPLGRHLPIDVKGMPNGEGESIEFVPTVPGKYKIAITYGNVEIPDSPITFFAQESILPKVSGDGLYCGQINEPCCFIIDAKDIYGSPEIKIDGPESETSFSIEKCNDIYKITYVPLEIGIFDIKVLWNGQEIPESPFHPHIVNIEKVRLIGGWENILDNHNRLMFCIGEEKKLIFDISEAGTGKLMVKIKHNNNNNNNSFEELPLEQTGSYKYKMLFKPKFCGEYDIYIYFENFLLPKMPIHAIVNENSMEGVTVVLRGHGLAGARVGEEAEIIIDGKDAGDGEPDVTLTGVKSDIKVKLIAIGPRLYKALYEPRIPGTYLLNVLWNQKQVKGCPLKVPILPSCDSKRVICTGDGLKGGTIGKEIKAFIDTRRAGPGELSAQCIGPNKAAICELYDQNDGTFTLLIHPQEGGKHTLTIKYGGQHIIGSPFLMRIYSAPDASKVRVLGPGIEHGVLPIYQSHFMCDTKGAGAGQLTVRIRGPKGAFKVEMQRESQKDRTIYCKYDPTEPGDYRIEVKWAGEHVPGSPFFVMIFDTQDELNRFLRNGCSNSMISLPPLNAIERMAGPNYSEEWKQISWKGSTADL
ncbi:hypothetical protein DERP_011908 [Dermatophagoides pteronyssinus]|uniref:Calponin-homology (CH) domain-containing protein n=1 Tax=Dermatophagoides pteronyssinus TaxID=6956 RepID=A0ABQ8J2P2_DERPT|nr:hypothetical protein DERP_011908 [Dermatophagoides pteronyssinus]